MTSVSITTLRILVLLLLPASWLTSAYPASSGAPISSEEVSAQSKIYKSRGEDVPEGYVTGRSLLSYFFTLPAEFTRTLAGLGPKDRWLDVGAGEGRAILDYGTSKYEAMYLRGLERTGSKAQAVAISIEDRRTPRWHETAASLGANQIQYFFGRRLREYSLEELGRFQVITDVLGAFSYTRFVSVFMEKALGFLELNGSLYTVLQDVRSENGTNIPYYPNAPFLTEIVNAEGSEVKICSWLKRITCVEVTCELKADRVPPIEVYRIHKVCNNVTVPSLTLVHFTAGTPPERRFQAGNPSPASLGRAGVTP